MALILDGKQVAVAYKTKILTQITALTAQGNPPGLAIILVGDDGASRIYTNRLAKLAEGLGVQTTVHELPATTAESEVLVLIERLNLDAAVHGILPMMPLPAHINSERVAMLISPDKDVDALSPVNAGLVAMGKSRWAPCTPRAVMAILDHYQLPIAGRHAVIIGRSNVVGKPLAHLLLNRHATVTVCHSKTADLASIVKQADIVVAAVGRAGLVTADMVKPGAVVIDVGINEVAGKVVGDVDFTSVEQVAGAITPVPGGVGAVTTTMVIEAVLRASGELDA